MKSLSLIKRIFLVLITCLSFYHLGFASPTLLPKPTKISPFHLTDDTNKPFTNQNLQGHWTFMFFGFTRCHDVCPETLSQLNQMYLQLRNKMNPSLLPQIVFVTVDPDRDTNAVLHNYVKSFNPAFIGLRGDANTLNLFKNEMKVYFAKVPKPNQDYSMEHSSQIFLLNPKGEWIGILDFPFQADQLITDYKQIINTDNSNQHE